MHDNNIILILYVMMVVAFLLFLLFRGCGYYDYTHLIRSSSLSSRLHSV